MRATKEYPIKSKPGDPVWELATLKPLQGEWTVEEYLELTLGTNHLIEYNEGVLEFLPMPTRTHQEIVFLLCTLLKQFLEPEGGDAWVAPIRVRLAQRKFREPDIAVFLDTTDKRAADDYFDGADMVVEVVSPDKRSHKRDYEQKRQDYARAGIPEYWIVDPKARTITVLKLSKNQYVGGAVGEGEVASSTLLNGFTVDVNSVFMHG